MDDAARKVLRRSHKLIVGSVNAAWVQPSGIHFESKLERACAYLLLLVPGVVEIRAQPLCIDVDLEKRHTYVPDFLVKFCDGTRELIEVKPDVFVDKDTELFDQAATRFADRQTPFFVVTDSQLTPDRIERARACNVMAKMAEPTDALKQLTRRVQAEGRLLIDDARRLGFQQNVMQYAVGRRILTTGPKVDLSPENWLSMMESRNDSESFSAGAWLGCEPWRPRN